jgi:hypothetical protein
LLDGLSGLLQNQDVTASIGVVLFGLLENTADSAGRLTAVANSRICCGKQQKNGPDFYFQVFAGTRVGLPVGCSLTCCCPSVGVHPSLSKTGIISICVAKSWELLCY